MRYLKYFSVLLFVLGIFLLRPYHLQQTGLMYGGDDESYFAHASALAFFQFPSYKNESFSVGKKMPMHSIGPGIMASPFVFIFSQIDRLQHSPLMNKRDKNQLYGSWSLFGFVIATYFYFCLGCYLLYFGVRYYFDEKTAFLSVVFMILLQGFPLFVFRRPMFAHIYEFFLQSSLVYILLRDLKTGFLNEARKGMLIVIGAIIGLIALVRYNNILVSLIAPITLFVCCKGEIPYKKRLYNVVCIYFVAFILFAIFRIVPLLMYGEGYADVMNTLSAVYHPAVYIQRILHILFGIDWGLIFTAPFLVIGVVYFFFLKNDIVKKKLMLFSIPMIANLYIVIMWGTQGAWYGYRYLIFSLAPLMVFPFAAVLNRALQKYGNRVVVATLCFVSLPPIVSMLSFEGNNSNLTLRIGQDYFAHVGYAMNEWGNRTYQLEVWKTIMFHPKEFILVLCKGGWMYGAYAGAMLLDLQRFIPKALLEKYPVFSWQILIQTVMIYVFPFSMYILAHAWASVFPKDRRKNDL